MACNISIAAAGIASGTPAGTFNWQAPSSVFSQPPPATSNIFGYLPSNPLSPTSTTPSLFSKFQPLATTPGPFSAYVDREHDHSKTSQDKTLLLTAAGRMAAFERKYPNVKMKAMDGPVPTLIGYQPTVKINVHPPPAGPTKEKRMFTIHRNFITAYSPWLFKLEQKAGNEISDIRLEDTDPDVFGTFANWLYKQEITTAEDNSMPSCGTLLNLWLLGDKIECPALQNHTLVVLDLKRMIEKRLPAQELRRVYANTTKDSPLRRYIVDSWSYGHITEDPSLYPHDLLFTLVSTNKVRLASLLPMIISSEAIQLYFVKEGVEQSSPFKRKLSEK